VFTPIENPDLFVLLVFDGVQLFIPQSDVLSVEIIADINITDTEIGAVGWFGQAHGRGRESPVFCLSADLRLIQDIPEKREYFVLLRPLLTTGAAESSAPESEFDDADVEDGADAVPSGLAMIELGITCDEVETINFKDEGLFPQALPAIMHESYSPITRLLMYQEKIASICEGSALSNYLVLQARENEQLALTVGI